MKAPCCRVCKKWGHEAGGEWIQFKVVDPKEIEYNNQKTQQFGHKFGNWFFCDEHLGLGLNFTQLTWEEAEPLIIKASENNEIPESPKLPKPPIRRSFCKRMFGKLRKNFS